MSKTSRYIIAIVCLLLFISLDLVFDYAFTFETSDYISFIFTLLSAVIVFVCTGKLASDKYYTATAFIKSNFDKVQVIFSILDIVCGIISIIAGLTFLFAIKIIKIIYVPVKLLDVANKLKSLFKPFAKFSLMWTATRNLEIAKGENMKFNEFVKANKWTILIGAVLSLMIAASVYAIVPTLVAIPLWVNILIAIVAFALAYLAAFFLGRDTLSGLALRMASKNLSEEKYEQLISLYNQLVAKEAEEEKILKAAQEKLEAEKEQKENTLSAKDLEEFNAKVQAKINELKAKEIQNSQNSKQ